MAKSKTRKVKKTVSVITTDPQMCGGRPCVRGMRIRVIDVLELLAAGLSSEEVLEEIPQLKKSDIAACLKYAVERMNHSVIKVA